MHEVNVLNSPDDDFSVLLHNRAGTWKIVEGRHDLEALSPLATGMDRSIEAREYRVITVFLNNTCNLRCDYCRFEPLTHHGVEHDVRDLEAVIASIRGVCRPGEHVEIHFQGGEPLLRINDIGAVCDALAGPGTDFHAHFHVTTNGTINSERALRVIEDHGIAVTLSIDGLPEVHDAHRTFPKGGGSFGRVLKTLGILRERNIPFGVFCVVSEADAMPAMHDYLAEELGLRRFLLAPLEIDGEGTAEALESYLECFFDWQLRLLERNIDRYLRDGVRVREQLGELLLRGKVSPSFYSKACGDSPHSSCGGRMHSIERNGDILPCQNSRMIAPEGGAYIDECMTRKGICETCEIRGHCSTPICFSRLAPKMVRAFDAAEPEALAYVAAACRQLKRREVALFRLFYRRKDDVLAYLAN